MNTLLSKNRIYRCVVQTVKIKSRVMQNCLKSLQISVMYHWLTLRLKYHIKLDWWCCCMLYCIQFAMLFIS